MNELKTIIKYASMLPILQLEAKGGMTGVEEDIEKLRGRA